MDAGPDFGWIKTGATAVKGGVVKNPMICPLCSSRECNGYPSVERNSTVYECKGCGNFTLTAQASSAMGTSGWKLATFVIEQNRRGVNPVFYSSQRAVPPASQAGAVGVDAAIETFPQSVAERLDRALSNIAAATQHLGQRIRIGSEGAAPLLLAQNTAEAFFVIQQLERDGCIMGDTHSLPTGIAISTKGLNRVADLQRGLFGPSSRQAFVAMSFHESLTEAWAGGLKLGIEDGGFQPLRVDGKEHNEKICDVIVAEIRRSKFLVADFTLHRGGVYFEAGLMMGLGRPVIFTCHHEDLKHAHFDTRQYNHIAWDTPADLREKLKRRIQATITP